MRAPLFNKEMIVGIQMLAQLEVSTREIAREMGVSRNAVRLHPQD